MLLIPRGTVKGYVAIPPVVIIGVTQTTVERAAVGKGGSRWLGGLGSNLKNTWTACYILISRSAAYERNLVTSIYTIRIPAPR